MGAERAKAPTWTVIVVEDDARTRHHFCQCIQGSRQLMLLAEFGTVREACQWIRDTEQRPDVLLTDLGLPDGSGITVITQILARFPDCEPLVISKFNDEEHVVAAIEAGAVGYVLKDDLPGDVVRVVLGLRDGGSPISPGIARHVLRRLRDTATTSRKTPDARAAATAHRLTDREIEILDLLSRGFSYDDIAKLKGLRYNTVASHVKNLYRKLHVKSRGEAVFEGMQTGLIQVRP